MWEEKRTEKGINAVCTKCRRSQQHFWRLTLLHVSIPMSSHHLSVSVTHTTQYTLLTPKIQQYSPWKAHAILLSWFTMQDQPSRDSAIGQEKEDETKCAAENRQHEKDRVKDRDEKAVISVRRLSSFVASIVKGAGPHGRGSFSGGGSGSGSVGGGVNQSAVRAKNALEGHHPNLRSGDLETCPTSHHAWWECCIGLYFHHWFPLFPFLFSLLNLLSLFPLRNPLSYPFSNSIPLLCGLLCLLSLSLPPSLPPSYPPSYLLCLSPSYPPSLPLSSSLPPSYLLCLSPSFFLPPSLLPSFLLILLPSRLD